MSIQEEAKHSSFDCQGSEAGHYCKGILRNLVSLTVLYFASPPACPRVPKSMLKGLLKFLPVETIIGYFFPDTLAKYHVWLEGKTPENAVALGEAAANELAQHFKPELVAPLAHYEEIANPVISATIAAIEAPTAQSVELAITEAVGLGANLLNSKATPEEIQTALANLFDVINKEIGA